MEHRRINSGKSILVIVSIALIIGSFSEGCYYDVEDILYPPSTLCDTNITTYTSAILPILENNCYICHDMNSGLGNVTIEPYAALKPYAIDGTLYCSISHGAGCAAMPKNSPKLLDCQIVMIKKWIDNGALEN